MLVSAHAACRPHSRPASERCAEEVQSRAADSTARRGFLSRRGLLGGASLLPALYTAQRATGAPAVVELTPESFAGVVASRAFVLFYAPWCPYCRALEPDFNALPGQLEKSGVTGTVVARMDVDKYTEYAQRFGVSAFPTLMLFVNGVAVGQHVGMSDAPSLLRYASTRLKTSQPAR